MRAFFTHTRLGRLLQDGIMVPTHALEGLAVQYRWTEPLYRLATIFYHYTRFLFYYGEEDFARMVPAGRRLLDLGTGSGYLLEYLADRFQFAVGLDFEPRMLAAARRLAPQAAFIRGDMLHTPIKDESVDIVTSLGAIQCVDYFSLAAEIKRVLVPGGEVFLLIEAVVIPFFAPASSAANLRNALSSAGLHIVDDLRIGRLYVLLHARKP